MNTVVLNPALSFGSQVVYAETVYVIVEVFDLSGATVTIPSNCILRFTGGMLCNGILFGNNTRIENVTNATVFDNVELCYGISLTSLTGWLGECRDTWFVYSDSSEYQIDLSDPNPDPVKIRAHYSIVKSVCQFEICYFSPRIYYINVWEMIHLRSTGCIILGGGAKFMLLKNKGTTHPAWGDILEYDVPYLFYKDAPNLYGPNYESGDKAGPFSVTDLTIIDNDSLTDNAAYGADVLGSFISYMIFYGSGASVSFENVDYDGMGGLWGDYNYRVIIDKVFLSHCRVRNSQFVFVLGNLLHTTEGTTYPLGGRCKSVIIRDCDLYNYANNPYVGPLSIVNSGANVASSITKHLLIERSTFESQKEGNLEVSGCESVEIRDCLFKSVQCSSENASYKVDQDTTAPINKIMIVTGSTFAISDDLINPHGGLRIYAGDLHFIHNVVYFDFSKSSTGSFRIYGYGNNEAVISGNTFIFSGTDLPVPKTMLVYEDCQIRLSGNNFTFLDDVRQYSEVFIDSHDDYYFLEVEDDPRFRNRGGGDYYSWQIIPLANRTAEGLLKLGETLVLTDTLPSRNIVEFDLRVFAIGHAKNGRHSFLSFTADDLEVFVQSYYGTFSLQIGPNYYASGQGVSIALPRLGFDALGKDLATVKVVFRNDSPTDTRVLLYINNMLIDTFSFPQISLDALSSLKLYGSPYLRIKNYRIRQYGMVAKNPMVHSVLTTNYNDGYPSAGVTAGRPSSPEVGYAYFDASLNKPVFFTGSAWVDASGTIV